MTPIISIIIPVYNQETALGKCINSVLEQKFSDFEIILVDDASTDFTSQVCKNYSKKDSRIQVITNTVNKGQGYSRNIALTQALGKYVTFVDSDDYIEPCLLVQGVDVLEKMPAVDIVLFDRKGVDIYGEVTDSQCFHKGIRQGIEVFQDFCMGKLSSYGVVAKIYRKSILDKHNISFPEYMWEDNLFTLKAYYYAHQVCFTAMHGYTRVHMPHPASAMNPIKFTPRHISGICCLVADIHDFFSKIATEQDEVYAKSFEQNFVKRFKRFYIYMATCYNDKIVPISCEDLQNILKAKFFLYALLEKLALLYATRVGFCEKEINTTTTYNFLFAFYENIQQKKVHTNDMFSVLETNHDILEQLLKKHILLINKIQKAQKISWVEQALAIHANCKKSACIFTFFQSLIPRVIFKKITKNDFALITTVYKKSNFETAVQFIKNKILPAPILADAYTALAKYIQHYDIQGATELAFLAYKADPKSYRLRWFAFRCREAGDVHGANKIFLLLTDKKIDHKCNLVLN